MRTILDVAKPSKGTSLKEQSYQIIKDLILSNRIPSGEWISENQLAKDLGISRSPLREAMAKLEREGFIEYTEWKGAKVVALTPAYVVEIYQVRAALEGMAAYLAAPSLTDEDLAELERQIHLADRREGDLGAHDAAEIAVHSLCPRRSGNSRLFEMAINMLDHMTRIRRHGGGVPGHLEASHREHLELLAALRTRDPERAERAFRAHLASVAERIAGSLASPGGTGISG